MIHGAIDGWSQMIRYNLATTVLRLFIGATSIHGLPSRVKANFGVKNVNVS